MGESAKAVCSLVMIAGLIATALAWFADRPDATVWCMRIGAPTIAGLALALLLRLHFRSDLVPDYLRQRSGTYFNRDGFAFAFDVTVRESTATLAVYFQNQWEQCCVGRVALRPARGFLLTRARFEPVGLEIPCEPAAFGVALLAFPIPVELQGKRQTFEVGASAHFPDGKGERVRFLDGVFLRANTDFGSGFSTAVAIAGAVTGSVVLAKPATVTLELPENVVTELPNEVRPEIVTLWRLGDPPLAEIGAPDKEDDCS